MRWILENLNIVIVIAGAIAWWLNQRAREREGKPADYDEDGVPEVRRGHEPPPFEDPELAERTRRIREEIQRKIAERRRAGEGYTEPHQAPSAEFQPASPREPAPPPVPTRGEWRVPEPPPVRRPMAVPPVPASIGDSRRSAEVLEQQAALADQLRQAEQMKAAAIRRAAFEHATSDASLTARRGVRQTVIAELRDPAALRRAFIEREILGPPVALR